MTTTGLLAWYVRLTASLLLCLQSGVLAVGDEIVTLGPSQGTQKDNCLFVSNEGSIDLWKIGTQGTPRWPYTATSSPESDPALYSYNPCYPFTQGNCKNAAVCRTNENKENDKNIGRADTAQFLFDEDQNKPVIQYQVPAENKEEEPVVTLVILQCQDAGLEDTFEVLGNTTPNLYIMTLSSHCCCLGGCSSDINPSSKKLSFGSILCILFVCVATVYFIGGILYMKLIRGAKGVEVIPNFAFWSDFPNLVMEGVTFVFTCGKATPSSTAYEDI